MEALLDSSRRSWGGLGDWLFYCRHYCFVEGAESRESSNTMSLRFEMPLRHPNGSVTKRILRFGVLGVLESLCWGDKFVLEFQGEC